MSSILRWKETHAAGGEAALAPKPVPGRPPKLRAAEQRRLWKILLKGAMAYGLPNEIWTLKRIARVIRREFGVRYHPSHVWKLLRAAGWSCQVPERRALQRDEEAIAHWKRHKWPAIKKKSPKTWGPPRVP
jgi:transposase